MCLPSTPHILSNTTSAESVKWGLNLSRLITKLKTDIQEKDLSNSTNMNQSSNIKIEYYKDVLPVRCLILGSSEIWSDN